MFRSLLAVSLVLAVGMVTIAAQDPKESTPPVKPEYHLSPLLIKNLKPVDHFIYAEAQTDYEGIMDALSKTFFPLMEKEGENGTAFGYPPIFIYEGATPDPKTKFKLTTGFPVTEATKPIGEFKIKKLDGLRCASVYYTGPLAHLGKAYAELFQQVLKAGHKPTGETRELYLYWEGEDSPNTVVEIQVAIAAEQKADEKK